MADIKLYNKNIPKSGVFLFPLLGTSRYNQFPHIRTYLICEEKGITEKSKKLIVSYKKNESAEFMKYEKKMLSGNKLFEDFFEHGDYYYYVFDLSFLKNEWNNFLEGRWSKLSPEVKKKLMAYHYVLENGILKENQTMDEVLNPHNPTSTIKEGKVIEFKDAFERYAPSLGVNPKLLREVGEIYSKPDLRNEELKL